MCPAALGRVCPPCSQRRGHASPWVPEATVCTASPLLSSLRRLDHVFTSSLPVSLCPTRPGPRDAAGPHVPRFPALPSSLHPRGPALPQQAALDGAPRSSVLRWRTGTPRAPSPWGHGLSDCWAGHTCRPRPSWGSGSPCPWASAPRPGVSGRPPFPGRASACTWTGQFHVSVSLTTRSGA